MKKFTVEVVQTVEIQIDETKLDEKFMQEFRDSFYQFDTIEDHAEHLGQLACRGLISMYSSFIEGYGPPAEMNIKIGDPFDNDIKTEIVETADV